MRQRYEFLQSLRFATAGYFLIVQNSFFGTVTPTSTERCHWASEARSPRVFVAR